MQSRFRIKVVLILMGTMMANVCAIVAFAFYVLAHPGPVPQRATLLLVCFFLVTSVICIVSTRRHARQMVPSETPEEGKQRRTFARAGIKIGLIFFVFALLNGIRLVIQNVVPWKYAIVGLSVDILLIATLWISLRKLDRTEPTSGTASKPEAFTQ